MHARILSMLIGNLNKTRSNGLLQFFFSVLMKVIKFQPILVQITLIFFVKLTVANQLSIVDILWSFVEYGAELICIIAK